MTIFDPSCPAAVIPPPGSPPSGCSRWKYLVFGDCVCSTRDAASLYLGLFSIACWAVAEVPQVIANCQASRSGVELEEVPLALVLTWIVGDVFNLLGCLLDPVTLPTQLFTAILYTSTTCVLVLQHVLSACSRKRQQRRRERRGRRLATPSRNAPLLEGPLPVGTTSASAAAAAAGAPVGADDGGDDDSDDGDYIEDDYSAPNGLYHTIIDEDSASLPRTLLPLPEASAVGGGNRGEQQRDTWHQGIGGRASGRRDSGSGSGSGNSGGGGSGGGGGSSGGGKSRSIPVGMPQRQSFGQ
ncbi:unnamed protein product [Closterium sp. NIES-53]